MKKILLLSLCAMACMAVRAQKANVLKSPDGTIAVSVTTGKNISYSVSADGNTILDDCVLGMTVDGKNLGPNAKLKGVKRSSINETLHPEVPLKMSSVQNRCNTMTMNFSGDFAVEFRAFDNGVAYRFVTRKKGRVNVDNETFTINFPADYTADVSHVNNFKTSCETTYNHISTKSFKPSDDMTYLPILIRTDKKYRILISETDLKDYPGMFLKGTGNNGMSALFPPCPLEFGPDGDRSVKFTKTASYIANTTGTRSFPWRYFMIAKNDKDILLNQLTYQLSSPCEIKNPSWIKPGQVSWDWWNHKMIWNVDFKSGINNDTYKYYIDFASKYGIPYIILDEGWAKSTTDPYNTIKDIDLPELIRYGKSKNVGLILWLPWLTVENHLSDIFAKYEQWGVPGVKIDFMDRQDQWMVNYYERVVKEAAKHHILVDFHGAYKPSGLDRRYPNLLSYEGVRGLENNEWVTPENSIYLPFMRNAVGAMDFTPGAMSSAQQQYVRSTDPTPMVGGTRSYHMALYVVFESGIQMLCDSPTRYYAEPECTEFIASVPVTWDETRVIDAKVGEYVVVAKRKGNKWFVGAITGSKPQKLTLPMSFLPAGKHHITYFQDGPNSYRQGLEYRKHSADVDNTQTYTLELAPNGGWCASID